uniref:cadherin-like domain-containing protein n=1 Tax=Thaumasiovibrio occultus TaxID=1891184 RepID=UPI00131E09B8
MATTVSANGQNSSTFFAVTPEGVVITSPKDLTPDSIIIFVGENGQQQVMQNRTQNSARSDDPSLTDVTSDIQAIIAAIETGQDPTQLGKQYETAAGEVSGSSLTTSAQVERTATSTIVESGFDTTGLNISEQQFSFLVENSGSFAEFSARVGISVDSITNDTTPTISGTISGSNWDELVVNVDGVDYTTTTGDVLVDENGNWTLVIPDENALGEGEYEVTATLNKDGEKVDSDVGAVEVDLTAVPGTVTVSVIAGDDTVNINESEVTQTVTGTATGGDISVGDKVTVTVGGNNFETTVQPDGSWSVDIPGDVLAGNDNVSVNVSSTDNVGNSVTSSGDRDYTVDLSPNLAPSVADKHFITDEDTAITITESQLLAGAVDANGDALTVSDVTYVGSDGSLVNNGDGTYTFTPSENFNGNVDLEFSVSDGKEATNGNITIDVTAVNDAPTAFDDAYSTTDIQPIILDLLANDRDPDSGDKLTVTSIAGVALTGQQQTITLPNGEIQIGADGTTITFIPSKDFEGDVNISYTVTDGELESSANATITVTDSTSPNKPNVSITEDANDDGVISSNELNGEVNVTIDLAGTNAVEGDTLTVNGQQITLTDSHLADGKVDT